jgi:anti-sigma B factor antagonist
MDIQVEQKNDVSIFKLNGSLDSNTSPEFEEKILETINNGTTKVVIDFSSLDYVSSAGLRVLNKAYKKLKHQNGAIILCSMQDYIKEVFEIAGFDYFLTIVPTLDDALEQV